MEVGQGQNWGCSDKGVRERARERERDVNSCSTVEVLTIHVKATSSVSFSKRRNSFCVARQSSDNCSPVNAELAEM
jgi:hypothetical protein